MSESKTPRTDAAAIQHYGGVWGVPVDVARQLERELAASEARVKELEEGLDCTRSHPHENMSRVCELKTVMARDRYHDAVQANERIADLEAENAAIRTLMNTYNLGGWTDAIAPMQRALRAEARLARVAEALRGMVGLVELIIARSDVALNVVYALDNNHRINTARAVLAEQPDESSELIMLVPREPTEAMLQAGLNRHWPQSMSPERLAMLYRAMLAAAREGKP